ncbi:unnamed protein product [Trichobilharzia szidati]|nr:unnamed protein product [Trichobilharzia szidati]
MADSDSNAKAVCESPTSPSKKVVDRPLGGIALFGPRNEILGEMKSRLKLRITGNSECKEETYPVTPTNPEIELHESSSYDNTSSNLSTDSSPRSSMYDDAEQSEFKSVSEMLMNRARKPPTRKPTLNYRTDNPHQLLPNSSSASNAGSPQLMSPFSCCGPSASLHYFFSKLTTLFCPVLFTMGCEL